MDFRYGTRCPQAHFVTSQEADKKEHIRKERTKCEEKDDDSYDKPMDDENTSIGDERLGLLQTSSLFVSESLSSFEHYSTRTDYLYLDPEAEITIARRISRVLSKWNWYFPVNGSTREEARQCLDSAWAHFEHVTLGRYICNEDLSVDEINPRLRSGDVDTCVMAKRGTILRSTKLFPVWKTTEDQLAQFGVGVGMYFFTLRQISFIFFIAFLIQIPVTIDYEKFTTFARDRVLVGSALCRNQQWKPCPSCTKEDWNHTFPHDHDRFATAGPNLDFILKNECDYDRRDAIFGLFTMLFVFVSLFLLSISLKRKAKHFDSIQQTTSDYSLAISNPPGDATDPNEWREFFSQFLDNDDRITLITVVLNNESLLKKLVHRREHMTKLELLLGPNQTLHKTDIRGTVRGITSKKVCCGLINTNHAEKAFAKILELETVLKEEAKQKFDVCDIFVMFETEQARQKVLRKLAVGKFNSLLPRALKKEIHLFRGKHVLDVVLPAEPMSIRWDNLNDTWWNTVFSQLVTHFLSVCLIVGCAACVTLVENYVPNGKLIGYTSSAFLIMIFNSITPMVVKQIMKLETHRNLGSWERSLYIKICLFRWTNTAIIYLVIVPFTSTLTADRLTKNVQSLFINELIYQPIFRLSDYMGHYQRHYKAPHAPDLRRMKLCFEGTKYDLAERYADVTKVLFLTFVYAPIFPLGFILGSIVLAVNYMIDKILLLRSWHQAANVGSELSKITTDYIFSALALAYAVSSMYFWSGFPFDNACEIPRNDEAKNQEYIGTHTIKIFNGTTKNITIDANTSMYEFCNQNIIRIIFAENSFPPIFSHEQEYESMTKEQYEHFTLFGKVCLLVVILIALNTLLTTLFKFGRKCLDGERDVEIGECESRITLSEIPTLPAYVPQVITSFDPFPFLACDVRGLDENFIGWSCEDKKIYNEHNLVSDMAIITEFDSEMAGDASSHNEYCGSCFSTIYYWSPND